MLVLKARLAIERQAKPCRRVFSSLLRTDVLQSGKARVLSHLKNRKIGCIMQAYEAQFPHRTKLIIHYPINCTASDSLVQGRQTLA